MPDDQALRAAFEALSKDAAFTDACPPADRLWAGARGELKPPEVEALALHLAECGACAEAWRVAKDFGTPAVLAAPARGFDWKLPAAAMIVLAAGVSLFYVTRPVGTPISPTIASVPPAPPAFVLPIEKAPIKVSSRYALTWRGTGDGKAFLEALKGALAPYERGEYRAAIDALVPLVRQYPDSAEPHFYSGVSMLLAGEESSAVAPLARARELADAELREDADWYLAVAYERAGRRDDAQRLAQTICDARGSRAAAACGAAAALRSRP